MRRDADLREVIGAVSVKLSDTRRIILDLIFDLVRLYRFISFLYSPEATSQDDLKKRIDELLELAEELEKNL